MLNNKEVYILGFAVCKVHIFIKWLREERKKNLQKNNKNNKIPPVLDFCKNNTAVILAVKEK